MIWSGEVATESGTSWVQEEKRAGARGAPARGVLGFEGKALRDLGRAVCHCAVMLIRKSHKSITTL